MEASVSRLENLLAGQAREIIRLRSVQQSPEDAAADILSMPPSRLPITPAPSAPAVTSSQPLSSAAALPYDSLTAGTSQSPPDQAAVNSIADPTAHQITQGHLGAEALALFHNPR